MLKIVNTPEFWAAVVLSAFTAGVWQFMPPGTADRLIYQATRAAQDFAAFIL